MPEEGKTLTAINLAISLSQELSQTVLLVDLDMRHPSIHHYFGFEVERGLVDYLEGKASLPELLVHPQGIDGLVILPAGRPTEWAAELIRSPRMLKLVPELKTFYRNRYVIFDLPPMLSFADALSFAPLADGIIMVVAARQTSREDLQRCQEMLQGRPIVGYVFNKAEDQKQSRYYRDYHYNGKPKRPWFFWMSNGKKK
jgi:capsular exopolysaccharide synthesis family protein